MSLRILIAGLSVAVMLGSCSSAYKAGQTPDDVYYSPRRPVNEEAKREREGRNAESSREKLADKRYRNSYWNPDDNYLRMKVRNRTYWNTIDDRDYWYSYDYSCRCNSNWSVYSKWGYNDWRWNNYYGYYGYNSGWNWWGYNYPVLYTTPRSNTGPKPYMGIYTNHTYDNNNTGGSKGSSNGKGLGNLLKTVFGSGNNGSSDTYSRPVRTFDNNSSSNTSGRNSSSSSNSSSGRSGSGSTTSTGRSNRN